MSVQPHGDERLEIVAVESIDDPRIEGYRDVRDRDLRGRDGRFVVESPAVVRRLLATDWPVESLLLAPRRLESLRDALAECRAPIYLASESLLCGISGYRIHGGALALVRRRPEREFDLDRLLRRIGPGTRSVLVALAGVTHMDNVGSIFRSAAGLGADGVLLDERCCDPLLRKPIRVAMGHSLVLPFAWDRTLIEPLGRLRRDLGYRVVAIESGAAGRAATALDRWRPAPRCVVVAGNEARGLEPALLDACDELVEIPMHGGVPSLNVAVAASIVLWTATAGSVRR